MSKLNNSRSNHLESLHPDPTICQRGLVIVYTVHLYTMDKNSYTTSIIVHTVSK